MAGVVGVGRSISNHHNQKQKQQAAGRGKIGWILDTFRKFAFDSFGSVSSNSKALKGNHFSLLLTLNSGMYPGHVPLHKTVHEELVNKTLLKPCNNEKPSTQSPEEKMQGRIEKMQKEMNIVKHTTMASSGNMKPISAKKPPPEQLKGKLFLMPNKNRIMIRSRL